MTSKRKKKITYLIFPSAKIFWPSSNGAIHPPCADPGLVDYRFVTVLCFQVTKYANRHSCLRNLAYYVFLVYLYYLAWLLFSNFNANFVYGNGKWTLQNWPMLTMPIVHFLVSYNLLIFLISVFRLSCSAKTLLQGANESYLGFVIHC